MNGQTNKQLVLLIAISSYFIFSQGFNSLLIKDGLKIDPYFGASPPTLGSDGTLENALIL